MNAFWATIAIIGAAGNTTAALYADNPGIHAGAAVLLFGAFIWETAQAMK